MSPILDPGAPLRSSLTPISATSEAFPHLSPQIRGPTPLSLGRGPLWQVLGQQGLPSCRSPSLNPGSQHSPRTKPAPGRRRRPGDANSARCVLPRPTVGVPRRPLPAGAVPWWRCCAPRRPRSMASLGATPLSVEALQIINNKEGKKEKRKPSFPNSQINFSRGWGRRICLEGDPNFCERPAGRLAWPGRPGQRSGPGAALGTSWGRGEPSRRVGGAATALFDVEPPAHPGAGIRGAPMSSNVRKFEEG